MNTAKQVIEQGHEDDVDRPGWETETTLFDAEGGLIAQDIVGGLTWGEALAVAFENRQGFRQEGYDKGFFIMTQTTTGWKVKIETKWRGVAKLEEGELPF